MNRSPENTFRPKRVAGALGAIGIVTLVAWVGSDHKDVTVIPKIQTESAAVLIDTNNEIPGRYYGPDSLLSELNSDEKSNAIVNINLAYEQLEMSHPKWLKNIHEVKALVDLWMNESRWQQDSDNPESDAYGIPQAIISRQNIKQGYFLGYADYKESAYTQIAWGLFYISETYKKPTKAWEHWQDHGWY